MTTEDSQMGAAPRAAIVGLVVLASAIGALLLFGERADGPAEVPSEPLVAESPEPAPAVATTPVSPAQPGARAPAQQLEENGRLTTTLESLREGDVLALGLGMPDVAREGVREVRLVDVEGRSLDVQGEPIAGSGTGLRIEIDPEWLKPGRYLIQVRTLEQNPLPVRRFVLEIE